MVAQKYSKKRIFNQWCNKRISRFNGKTGSGKLFLIETKGDQLENSEPKEKAETGAKWAEMAGRMYKYYMVFETKNPGYNGAYSYEEFMRIVKELQ